ncbi:MAG: hypothetical protein ACK4X1_06775 [Terricaulis sp.]
MRFAFLALFVWVAASCAHAADCDVDRTAVFAQDVQTFDQSPTGWRSIGDTQGCELAAAQLIADYRTHNAVRLVNGDPDSIAMLNWHEGQLRAVAGEIRPAIDRMNVAGMNADPVNALYVQATAAFLARQRPALETIRARLAAQPEPSWFAEAQVQQRAAGREISWPPNLDVVDGLIACYDRPYREAYSEQCRPRR